MKPKANLSLISTSTRKPLQVASAIGRENIVRRLLDHGADVNTSDGIYGSALRAASETDHEIIVEILLDHGADVNASVAKHGTALQIASAKGHENIVKILLNHGADVKFRDAIYGSALQAASANGHENIVRLLREYVSIGTNIQGTSAPQTTSAKYHKSDKSSLPASKADDMDWWLEEA